MSKPESQTALAIPHDAKPAGDVELLSLLLAVRAWTNMQTIRNTNAVYDAALRYWGVKPVIPE